LNDSSQIERALLGSILLDGKRIYESMTLVKLEDFALNSHREIYGAMLELAQSGQGIETTLLAEKLRHSGSLERVGGWSYLGELTTGVGVSFKGYAKGVVEHSRRRRFVSVCELGTSVARDGDELEQCISRVETGLLTIRADENKPEAIALKGFALATLNQMLALRDSPNELIGYSTGVPELDLSTTGVRAGELWVIGALPGRGKTAAGLQIAASAARAGTPTLFFSLEMGKDQLLLRLLSGESGVSATKVRNPRWLNESQIQYLTNSAGDVMEWPLYVDDSSSLTAHELMARAKLYIRRFGVKLIIVDYLRLIEAQGRELRERVANAANCLRQVAKDENVAVVALSQLKRPPNINDRPTMIDLKESGDVEAHAHTVLLLYQPVENGEFTHEDEIIIGKQRNGPLGTVKVVFDTKTLRFLPREGQQ
jgi:replicative DNA helicase